MTEPCFVPGSKDLLTSINGYCERRPGFANTVEPTPTNFSNLQRTFTWDDFNGNFYVMFSDINVGNGTSAVYKMQLGVDSSAVLLFTDSGSTQPFDYVVSNGIVYFGNGHVMKKWNQSIGVQNWGIATGTATSGSSAAYAGAASDISTGGAAWSNTGNATGAPDGNFATVTASFGVPTDLLALTTYGFAASGTMLGVQVAITGKSSGTAGHRTIGVQLLVNGTPVGTQKFVTLGTTSSTVTLGSASDLWGTTLSSSNVDGTGFGVAIQGNSTGAITTSIDAAQITVFFLGGPTVTKVGSGSFNAYIGYEYVFCYGNSLTGHLSSPTIPSGSTGAFGGIISSSALSAAGSGYAANDTGIIQAGNFNATYTINTVAAGGGVLTYTISGGGTGFAVANGVSTKTGGAQPGTGSGFAINITAVTGIDHLQVALTASTDPQVNQIRVFRTTDSVAPGVVGGTLFELPTSPYPNTTANISDNATDSSLITSSIAPTPGFNDPPPASFGFTYYNGRIHMFANTSAGFFVYFTGLEEITNGVPEESVVSGIAGNFWKFDQPVNGLGLAGINQNQTQLVFCGGRIYGITGTTLDTLQRFRISDRRGARNRAAITMMGGMCAWLDSANQIWATDGNSLEELSPPIRPDIAGIQQSAASLTFHTAGRFHWLLVSTGQVLLPYDVDTEQWMPPWSVASQYVYSGETSPGNYQLMTSTGTRALALSTTAFNDNGLAYQPVIRTNLFALIPDFGRRFSYIATGIYDEPTRTGQMWYVGVDTNNTTLADVGVLTDDDPRVASAPYQTITPQATTPEVAFLRKQGVNIKQNLYAQTQPPARWLGLQIVLQRADQTDNLYGWYLAYKAVGGR